MVCSYIGLGVSRICGPEISVNQQAPLESEWLGEQQVDARAKGHRSNLT